MSKLQGVYVVMTTPFTAEGGLDERGLRANMDWFISQGVHGLICNGSTSEFATLERSEWQRALEITMDQARGRVPVICGTAAVSTRETIERTNAAAKAGAAAALVVCPYYGCPSQAELAAHFSALAASASLPIMVYNNPGLSGVDLLPATLAVIANNPNIQYVKESSGDFKRIHEIQNLTQNRVDIWCGWEDLALEFFLMGATGWVAPTANFAPGLCVSLYEHAKAGRMAQARAVYDTLLPLLQFLEEGQFLAKCKAAQDLIGLNGGTPRLPFLPVDVETKEKLAMLLREAGLL